MPTPKQQLLYTRLSGQLQAIGLHYYQELPSGAASLLMKVSNTRVFVEVYDQHGKLIGEVPNEKTSAAFVTDLQTTFAHSVSPDPGGVIAMLARPDVVAK